MEALKDPDHGIYPMVTSSSTLAAYGATEQEFRHMRSNRSLPYAKHILPLSEQENLSARSLEKKQTS